MGVGRTVKISAPSHVHAGNYDIHGGLGRLYGTLGFALEKPRLEILLRASENQGVTAEGERADEARLYAERVLEWAGCGVGVRITVKESIPSHVGLGSTTALALSVGYGVLTLCGVSGVSLEELASLLGRGRVSALGVYSFKLGGFIVDGGFRPGSPNIPPLVFRAHVPARVRLVVALPEAPIARIRELKSREDEVLASMKPMPEELALRASRTVLVGVMANIAEGRWDEASRWLGEFNRLLGEYWAERQGGVYCCSLVERLVGKAVESGAWAALQSSWGPTTYAIASPEAAVRVERAWRMILEGEGGGMVWTTRVDNEGARITVEG